MCASIYMYDTYNTYNTYIVYIKERKLSELVKIHYSQKELTTKGISPQNTPQKVKINNN